MCFNFLILNVPQLCSFCVICRVAFRKVHAARCALRTTVDHQFHFVFALLIRTWTRACNSTHQIGTFIVVPFTRTISESCQYQSSCQSSIQVTLRIVPPFIGPVLSSSTDSDQQTGETGEEFTSCTRCDTEDPGSETTVCEGCDTIVHRVPSDDAPAIEGTGPSCDPISNSDHSNHGTVLSTSDHDARATNFPFLSRCCSFPCLSLLLSPCLSFSCLFLFPFPFPFSLLFPLPCPFLCQDPCQPTADTVTSESLAAVLTAATSIGGF